jgi:glycosyltransferase involved in cell wall biosynthesis
MLGIPVIASNLPGVREPVKQTGLGLLVQPRSARDITEKLQKIFEVDLDRAYALEIAKRDYEATHIADSYEEMFLQTILERE